MKYGRYGWPYLFLRIGLGLTFIYLGIDVFRNPEAWAVYAGGEPFLGFDRDALLKFGGIVDLIAGLMLMAKVMPRFAGGLMVAHLLMVFAMNGIDSTLARNIGLFGMALAIMRWPNSYHKKRKKGRRGRKSSGGESDE